jgi:hypothetical protein
MGFELNMWTKITEIESKKLITVQRLQVDELGDVNDIMHRCKDIRITEE